MKPKEKQSPVSKKLRKFSSTRVMNLIRIVEQVLVLSIGNDFIESLCRWEELIKSGNEQS
jgi:hypothetical protein